MQTGLRIALASLALETAGGIAAVVVLWRRRRTRAPNPPDPPVPLAPMAVAPAAVAPVAAPAIPPAPAAEAAALEIEDGREVVVTPMRLVWGRLGGAPEHYEVRVDTVSGDALVFAGETRRLDQAAQRTARHLFHTLDLPQERLLAAHDAGDAPIADIRAWLRGLPSR